MIWLGLLGVVVFLCYKWSTNTFHKWDGKGIKVLKPYPLLGSSPRFFLTWPPIPKAVQEGYEKYREFPYLISYVFKEDTLVVHDPDLVKAICVKDADHFVDRPVIDQMNELHPEQKKMLINLKGEEWKSLRNSLSPSFTTGKLRNVMNGLHTCGHDFSKYIKSEIKRKDGGSLQMKDTFKRYTMGAIASSVFGVEAQAFETEDSEFVKNAKEVQVKFTFKLMLKALFVIMFPGIAKSSGMRIAKKNMYFYNLTKAAMSHRRSEGSKTNDILQLLIDLQDQKDDLSKATTDQLEEDNTFEKEAELVGVTSNVDIDEDVVTQSGILFLLAGFDTTALTLSICSYYLALNQEVQEKAREEVDEITAALAGREITYEEVRQMEYLDMVICEALRMAPIANNIERRCTKEYTLPCGAVIPKGMKINIPVKGIQNDPDYFDNPDEFRPERFSRENKSNIRPGTYLPFGLGPRNCIGMRFAMMECKVALFHLLRDFVVNPCEKTPVPIRFSRDNFLTEIEDGNWLQIVPREE